MTGSVRAVMRQGCDKAQRQVGKVIARRLRNMALGLWRLSYRFDENLFDTVHHRADTLGGAFVRPVNLAKGLQDQELVDGGARLKGRDVGFFHFSPVFKLKRREVSTAADSPQAPIWQDIDLRNPGPAIARLRAEAAE